MKRNAEVSEKTKGKIVFDFEEVTKVYKTFTLDRVNIQLKKHQFLALLGPNGSGKTTLILSILKLIPAKFKKFYWKWNSIYDVYRKIGVQFQDSLYNDKWTVKDVINISTKFNTDWKHIDKTAKNLGIDDINRLIKKFSKGQRQKIDILIALANKPELLILDEMTSSLDPTAKAQVIEYLKFLGDHKKISLVITSHFLDELEGLCDSFLFLKNGKRIKYMITSDFKKTHPGFLMKEYRKNYPSELSQITKEGNSEFAFTK